ncbi:flavin reductase [Lacticaseibacillus parahuelsenbergensis]|uniref:Flavin reductase n=1 Tax=Lacticaseibacillus parahuelsenbergensis TaxID=3068305 RepID=A0ABY9L6W7_9LACO|nr:MULTISPECIES: flavin reductase [Lacticaseibacillus]MDE3283750.1 flavin reductase family protein [Lacticaseibacillus casei]WLV79477.1 flavin reductase [Lacticaseibacillus sp. NCIMB 15471]
MLVPYTTKKLYYAYPIFIIGYQDDRCRYNVTTCSSSYSLGDMFTFSVANDENVAKQLQRTRHCTINYMTSAHLDQIEYAGYLHRREKLNSGQLPHQIDPQTDLPILTDALSTLFIDIEKSVPYHGYINFIGHITRRLVQEDALQNGRLNVATITPALYAGDQHQRVYREVNQQVNTTGQFFRQRTRLSKHHEE